MAKAMRSWRSLLYIPCSNVRALDKARTLPADAIIFDLEDAVAPQQKDAARDGLAGALSQGGYGDRQRIVRINGLETPWGRDDLEAVTRLAPDAVLLPKVGAPQQVEQVAEILGTSPATSETTIWAMMETAQALPAAWSIARARRMAGFVVGTNDLAAELGCEVGGDRMAMMMALQTFVGAARAAEIHVVDGVFNAFRDTEGLRAECQQGRALGMDGKSLIHPDQIEVANRIFTPSEDEVARARAHIEVFEEAEAEGRGVAVHDGQIVESLHVRHARSVLSRERAARDRG